MTRVFDQIWSNIILGISVRVFLDQISIYIDTLSGADCAPQCEWATSNQLKGRIKQKHWP